MEKPEYVAPVVEVVDARELTEQYGSADCSSRTIGDPTGGNGAPA